MVNYTYVAVHAYVHKYDTYTPQNECSFQNIQKMLGSSLLLLHQVYIVRKSWYDC